MPSYPATIRITLATGLELEMISVFESPTRVPTLEDFHGYSFMCRSRFLEKCAGTTFMEVSTKTKQSLVIATAHIAAIEFTMETPEELRHAAN